MTLPSSAISFVLFQALSAVMPTRTFEGGGGGGASGTFTKNKTKTVKVA